MKYLENFDTFEKNRPGRTHATKSTFSNKEDDETADYSIEEVRALKTVDTPAKPINCDITVLGQEKENEDETTDQ